MPIMYMQVEENLYVYMSLWCLALTNFTFRKGLFALKYWKMKETKKKSEMQHGQLKGVPSAESSRSVRGLGKGVSDKPYPRLCNARRPRIEPRTFRSQAVRETLPLAPGPPFKYKALIKHHLRTIWEFIGVNREDSKFSRPRLYDVWATAVLNFLSGH